MIQQITRDVDFLKQPSTKATPKDKQAITDLTDTFNANAERAVGLAANMIGVDKQIIIVKMGLFPVIMVNPVITSKKGSYKASEGCLSLFGERETTRYHEIEVRYLDANFKPQRQKFTDFIAEVIQHEVDHCNGIII